MNDSILNYREAAVLLGVPVGSLYAWVAFKKISHLRYGPRSVRFDRNELLKFKEANAVPCNSKKDDEVVK